MQTPSILTDYLTIKDSTEYRGLAVFPVCLLSSSFEATDKVEVIGGGDFDEKIQSVETGRMNTVRIMNHGDTPVLIPDGAVLIGGAANRMVTQSAVIRKDEIAILQAVSVEAQRWDCEKLPGSKTRITAPDPTFKGSVIAPASLRRLRLEKSIPAMKRAGISKVNQGMIWKQIIDLFEKTPVKSQNLDVCELYNHWDYLNDEYSSRIKPVDLQVGCIAIMDRNTWYLDVFYNTTVFKKLFPNLLKSYAMDAIMARIGLTDEEEYNWIPELIDAQDAFAMIKLLKINPLQAGSRKDEETGFFVSSKACGAVHTHGCTLLQMTVCSRGGPVLWAPRSKTQRVLSKA